MKTYTAQEAAERVAELARPSGITPFLLGIVGPPGAGKSTLAELAGVPMLPMDGYHYANEHLDRLGLRAKKGAPETFDTSGYASALSRLRAGSDATVPRFDRTIDEAVAGSIPLSGSASLIITEGNYLLHDRDGWQMIRPLLDEVWYIDVDDELRRSRLEARHRQFGRTPEDAARWVAEVDEPNAVLIRATRHRADATITFH